MEPLEYDSIDRCTYELQVDYHHLRTPLPCHPVNKKKL